MPRGDARGFSPTIIKKFKGLDRYHSVALVPADTALDLLNVIPSRTGQLEKMRLPVAISPAVGGPIIQGPTRIFDFQMSFSQLAGTSVRQAIAHFGSQLWWYPVNGDGTLGAGTLLDDNAANVDEWDAVISNNILFMCNGRRMVKYMGDGRLRNWGIASSVAPTPQFNLAPPVGNPGLTFTQGGRRYRFSYAASYGTGAFVHISSASATTAASGNFAGKVNKITVPASGDPQVDWGVLWATLDGGGGNDYFYHSDGPIGNYTGGITDVLPDASLDVETRAPFYNDPPPTGRYLARYGGRIIIFGLTSDPTLVAYTGYEKILTGRPEESCPPNNRLRLSTGADDVAGGGVIQAGIVAFSRSNEMFMLRGQLEDITAETPVSFSAFLDTLPWREGCLSHYAVRGTKYGLIWWGADRMVKTFGGGPFGFGAFILPKDISGAASPILRSATVGMESQAQAEFFNYLDRDWYCLYFSTGGSGSLNTLLIFDMTDDQNENVGIFVSDIQADSISTIEAPNGQRSLIIGKGGKVWRLQVISTTTSGVEEANVAPPSTNGVLKAYWRGGYVGNDTPATTSMYRFGYLITDQADLKWRVGLRCVDMNNKFESPRYVGPINVPADGKISVNLKTVRMSWEIMFPDDDVSCNVTELQCQRRPISNR